MLFWLVFNFLCANVSINDILFDIVAYAVSLTMTMCKSIIIGE